MFRIHQRLTSNGMYAMALTKVSTYLPIYRSIYLYIDLATYITNNDFFQVALGVLWQSALLMRSI